MGIFSKIKDAKTKKSTNTIDDKILNTLDPSIRPLIKLCNDNGITTYACCSGNDLEHSDPDYWKTRGYVAFQDSPEARAITAKLLDYEDFDINISSAPKEAYEYFNQVITGERFAVHFDNNHGENMQKVYERFDTAIKQKSVPQENLKMVDSLIKKFREQSKNFEYSAEFNNICNPEENFKSCVWINEVPLLEDKENVANVELLSKDISSTLNTTDKHSDIGLVYVPEFMGKNVLPVLDLIKKQVVSNKEKYTLSREEARKEYDEVYDEQEFEYLGYEEEYEEEQEVQSDFEEELDKMFPEVSMEELNSIFGEISNELESEDKEDIDNGDYVI